MCGIIGIVGHNNCIPKLIDGLKRLEYRGYDSAGIAVLDNQEIAVLKEVGKIAILKKTVKQSKLNSNMGIAHTRWATHGEAIKENSHPHFSDKIALVHNGIIENFEDLKYDLERKGYEFRSQTDSEVIVWLITDSLNKGKDIKTAIRDAVKKLKGAYAIAVIHKQDENHIYCVRQGSPLAIGYGKDEMYVGSDAIALGKLTKQICFLENGDFATLSQKGVEIIDEHGRINNRKIKNIKVDGADNLGKFKHHMQKEIFEQPKVLKDTFDSYQEQQKALLKQGLKLKDITSIKIIACGTAYYAGCIAASLLESMVDIQIETDVASEFRYRKPFFDKKGLAIFVSQSGETADTISALNYCKDNKQKTLAIVNVPESSITRESDYVLYTKAGAEIGVASTKAFTTQVLMLSLLMANIAKAKVKDFDFKKCIRSLKQAPQIVESMLKQEKEIEKIAHKFKEIKSALYLGRNIGYGLALEGALKLKEISYLYAFACPAGEMKHGPIALIDNDMLTVAIAPYDRLFDKMISNVKEIQARKGKIILITDEKGKEKATGITDNIIVVPKCDNLQMTFSCIIPLQLFAYFMAVLKKRDVDQPRNLAKSVTVE